ncbi:cytochrome P450 [Nocardia gipuzkoensis]|uniref:cytochrome P450 n=1 Tax=Nocardia gipuzkoensis TaxID=2749991 RepID=UPI00237E91D1|nr:cytochrome P450 [Nocardia gipuzkoensis]MDE1675212.1 cytochrome P450 [Nocardia gipuzkoensis]
MTTPPTPASSPSTTAGMCPVSHGSPFPTSDPRIPLYGPDYATDPHRFYRDLRERFGALAPVELAAGVPATLVLRHETGVSILHDTAHFGSNPSIWQQSVPADSPVLAMMRYQDAARFNDADAHKRLRKASADVLAGIDLFDIPASVEQIAVPLINSFCEHGHADLLEQYASKLVLEVLNQLIGCPPHIGDCVATGMALRFDSGGDATRGMAMLREALMTLIRLKRAAPGDDITSRLASHPAGLDDEEMFAQLMSLYGAGFEPQRNLIANTALLALTDERFHGGLHDGSLSTRDALDEVLFADPPMANFAIRYPLQPMMLDGTWLPAHQPVIISLAGCNDDLATRGGDRTGNRSHLAWGAGPHICPAKSVAYLVVQHSIDQLLDALPEMRLAVAASELRWRSGPFHRALSALPVTFPPSPPLETGLWSIAGAPNTVAAVGDSAPHRRPPRAGRM